MTGLCWIRRDLRLHDHAALRACAQSCTRFYVVFIFDEITLAPLRKKSNYDKRVHFIAQSLLEINATLIKWGGGLIVRHANPVEEIPKLVKQLNIDALYFNRDYTPYSIERDQKVANAVTSFGCQVHSFKDHVIFEPHEILNQQSQPYRIFTPYSISWQNQLNQTGVTLQSVPSLSHVLSDPEGAFPESISKVLSQIGFHEDAPFLAGGFSKAQMQLAHFQSHISNYATNREFPSIHGTSKLSVYLRFGCISIREAVAMAQASLGLGAEKWLSELIWREFYQMIFFHFPIVQHQSFQEKYRHLQFPTSEPLLAAFKAGQTGFPLIDAAMRCLNQTGWMHNRLRMICASFLTKILLVDWKRGERYFAWKLLDYELPSNNGGWQWAAGVGCDAAPYFRIFNPTSQSEKYDSAGSFIRQYCPELMPLSNHQIHNPSTAKQLPRRFRLGRDYPIPIIEYASQRQKALDLYQNSSATAPHRD